LREARGEAVDLAEPELKLGMAGRLPPEWIPEEDVRLALYLRLARLADGGALDAFEAELSDRFGELRERKRRPCLRLLEFGCSPRQLALPGSMRGLPP
jgi:transcription-repair coupling factor (superfamily II helicase)